MTCLRETNLTQPTCEGRDILDFFVTNGSAPRALLLLTYEAQKFTSGEAGITNR